MQLRVVMIGDHRSYESLKKLLPEEGVSMERRDAGIFWADPSAAVFDLAIVSFADLPAEAAGAIRRVRALAQKPEIAVFGAGIEEESRLTLLAAGCFAIVPAGLQDEAFVQTWARLVSRRREALTVAVRAEQAPEPPRMDDFVAESPATQSVLRVARRIAVSDTSVLLLGATGAGKEWLARAIHRESPRASGPFIAVNCGAIPETLLESELFGHEKGAFTGATRARRGYFEQAHGGTLLLDEIGEMSPHLQVRLLRVLQERAIQRLGSERPIEIDTRVIAATHRDPKAQIESGQLREDLYYRLAVVTLVVPSLHERVEDIPRLAGLYLHKFARKFGRPEITGVTEPALDALKAHSWPGNVRELINVIERAVLLCEGEEVDLVDLPVEIAASPAAIEQIPIEQNPIDDLDAWIDQPIDVGRLAVVADFERRYFSRLLERTQGNVGKTAEQAGVDPRTLYNKMRQLGLRKEDFRR